jgi:dTDP-4-dehydrorhamnose reductase
MKVLIVGSLGQLGNELQRTCPPGLDITPVDVNEIDITDLPAVLALFEELAPQVVINCAAYTAVDGAETKPDLAVAVNAEGPGNLARGAERTGSRLLHVSTDFVFDGSANTPYLPLAEARPLGVYGHSKLAGERRVQEILPLNSLIVRTSWLYSGYGANFVKTMLGLMNERTEIRVVADQVGTPTWARGLAEVLWRFADDPSAHGLYHWSDAGSCSWHEFATAIFERGRELGLVHQDVEVLAIPSEEYPTPAARPPYSVLDCSSTRKRLSLEPRPWRDQLHSMLDEMLAEESTAP